MKADEKKCPECAETIKLDALVCRFCGHRFASEEVEASRRADEAKKKRDDKDARNGLIGCGVIAVLLCALLAYCSSSKVDPQAAARERQRLASEAAEDRRKGLNCLSDLNGANDSLVQQVKDQLREPSSFEHVGTKIGPADRKGDHVVVMQYRAHNGFGGVNNGIAIGTVHPDCSATVKEAADG